jgi:prophage antirepressor-like protein
MNKLSASPHEYGKAGERYVRNKEKLAQAEMAFEFATKESFAKMVELAHNKQTYINPLVT